MPEWPSNDPRARRKSKLKMRFKHCLDKEIERTKEKLEILHELKHDRDFNPKKWNPKPRSKRVKNTDPRPYGWRF